MPAYKTFPAALREWLAERPWQTDLEQVLGEDAFARYDLGENGLDDVDDGNPGRHEVERMLPNDPLAGKPKRVKLTGPTVFEQIEQLELKFHDPKTWKYMDRVFPICSSCAVSGDVKTLVHEVVINKNAYPTEKALTTLFAAALFVDGRVPLKIICGRLGVSRRSIEGWLPFWLSFKQQEDAFHGDGPHWKSDPIRNHLNPLGYDDSPDGHFMVDEDGYGSVRQLRAPHKRRGS